MRRRNVVKTIGFVIFILNLWIVYHNVGKDGLNGPASTLGYAQTRTPTAILYERIYQNRKFERDPNFNMRLHVDSLIDTYPEWIWPEFRSVNSEAELRYVKGRVSRDIRIKEELSHTSNGKAGWAMVMAYAADPIIILSMLVVWFTLATAGKARARRATVISGKVGQTSAAAPAEK